MVGALGSASERVDRLHAGSPKLAFPYSVGPGSWLSAINDLKGCSRVKFALILLRKKGQINRLGAQCSTARSCSSAVGPMALSTITGRAFQPIVCTSTIVGDQLQQVT